MESMDRRRIDKMDARIKTAWVEALRSGDYEQGYHGLHLFDPDERSTPHRFCCLGVLCEVMNIPCLRYCGTLTYAGSGAMPTVSILQQANLAGDFVNKLVELNDHRGASFAEIADYIEENL
jgi:hypothetical protein